MFYRFVAGKKIIIISATLIFVLSFLFLSSSSRGQTGDSLQVSYIDVGQGDSIWLHASDGTDILVDGGPPSAGPTVVAYLQEKGVDDIEVLVLSHADSDHSGGLIDLMRSTIPVGSVVYNGQSVSTTTYLTLLTEMGNRGLTPTPVSIGQNYTWGPITTSVLNPQATPTGSQNEDSVVFLATYGNKRFLFTGDIGSSTEQTIIASGTPITADVLKVAHHGSAYSSSTSFLDSVRPKLAIISVGANNPYGHPDQETLDRLTAAGGQLFRTDERGTIIVSTDGQVLTAPPGYVIFLPAVLKTSPSMAYGLALLPAGSFSQLPH